MKRSTSLAVVLLATLFSVAGSRLLQAGPAGGAHSEGTPAPAADDNRTPEARMNARFPQKVLVGDLIGLAIQDHDDSILGHVTDVAQTPDGRIVLVMSDRRWFRCGGRLISVPLETVAILGRHLNLLDIPRDDVASLPTWTSAAGRSLDRSATIRIAIGRR